jgi:molybdate-binding protein
MAGRKDYLADLFLVPWFVLRRPLFIIIFQYLLGGVLCSSQVQIKAEGFFCGVFRPNSGENTTCGASHQVHVGFPPSVCGHTIDCWSPGRCNLSNLLTRFILVCYTCSVPGFFPAQPYMDKIEALHAFEQLKQLSDSRRLTILRLLMAEPATLTQLGQKLGQSPAWVRHHIKILELAGHHIKILEAAGLIEISEKRVVAGITEKYYKARASALLLQELILPKTQKPVIIFSGSHDTAIEHIAGNLSKHVCMLTMPVGSLDGLVNLRQGLCHISGSHLLDINGEYNLPFVRHLFPDVPVSLMTMAHRTQGLILAPGNPKGIKSLADLARPEITFINRNAGSGTRLWLDREFTRLGLSAISLRGYGQVVSTHTEAARAVQNCRVDVAIGIQASASEAGLDFIPLFEERYDLIFPEETAQLVGPILDHLQTLKFRQELNSLSGYNTTHSGEQILLD